MSSDPDIFGKIDAMLGKRAGFAGTGTVTSTTPPDHDEFPVLTDVVKPRPTSPQARPASAVMLEHMLDFPDDLSAELQVDPSTDLPPELPVDALRSAHFAESRIADSNNAADTEAVSDIQRLHDNIEARLGVLLGLQQTALEEMLRRVVRQEVRQALREEIDRATGHQAPD